MAASNAIAAPHRGEGVGALEGTGTHAPWANSQVSPSASPVPDWPPNSTTLERAGSYTIAAPVRTGGS